MQKNKSISELKDIWESEKESFRVKELGGLQGFIEDVLLCDKLFSLRQGKESTKLQKRSNEFTRETHKEGGRGRADFVIYIDKDEIVIPVEVEKFGNITAGERQILQYQTDWRKKYGILTDGNEWRLYVDRYYETYHLSDIFDKKSEFWKKWKLYISPENYYDTTFNPQGNNLSESKKLDLNKAENRPFFFNDITSLLRNFRSKIVNLIPLFAKDEKLTIEISYSYLIQFILYKVLIDNEYKKLQNKYNSFRERVKKAIHNKDFYEIIITDIKEISEYIYKNVYKPFRKEQEDINKQLIKQLKKSPTFNDISPWLDIIMFIDRYNFADIKNELFGFVYENYLKELYKDENKGQYFTDPAVVNFMLEQLGYTPDNLKKDAGKISIIDPSCGAGTFLYSAVESISKAFYTQDTVEKSKEVETLVNDNVFGLDIEGFPLFLAEMNILMRLLPVVVHRKYKNPINEKLKLFKTNDSIAEFLDTSIAKTDTKDDEVTDLFASITEKHINSYMRDDKDLDAMFRSLEGDLIRRQRFDYVIGNPPYVGLRSCGHLPSIKIIRDKHLWNNLYGMNLHSIPGNRKRYSPKPNLYAFFIALGLGLLKDNGVICYIIPQLVLTAGDLDVLRYHLAKYTTIEKIITFEGNLFLGRGLKQNKPVATSSLIFVARKTPAKIKHKVKVINYSPYTEKQGKMLASYFKKGSKKTRFIAQADLLNNVENWNFIKATNAFTTFFEIYQSNSDDMSIYYTHTKAQPKFGDTFWFDGGVKLQDDLVVEYKGKNQWRVFNPKINNNKLFTAAKTNLFYDKGNPIKIIQGSQGIPVFETNFKILWKTRFVERFQFSDEKDLLLNNNQSLVISSNNRTELLYLLSVLNSPISLTILRQLLKVRNEAIYIVPITAIKQYIRVPKIDTAEKKAIKAEIIKQTEEMLNIEKPVLQDIVNFDGITMQKFSNVQVVGNDLVLSRGEQEYMCRISHGKSDIVYKTIIAEYFPKGNTLPVKDIIISELKFLPAIDFVSQSVLKNYIDDLVFALYFNVSLPTLGINNVSKIQDACATNEFYEYV